MRFKITSHRPPERTEPPPLPASAAPVDARGLGDTLATVTKATGVAWLVQWVSTKTGWNCGCAGRIQWFNRLLPYGKNRLK